MRRFSLGGLKAGRCSQGVPISDGLLSQSWFSASCSHGSSSPQQVTFTQNAAILSWRTESRPMLSRRSDLGWAALAILVLGVMLAWVLLAAASDIYAECGDSLLAD